MRFNANEDFLPHNSSDEIVIKDSIEQTTEDTIYSVLLRIAKRFNCGLFTNTTALMLLTYCVLTYTDYA